MCPCSHPVPGDGGPGKTGGGPPPGGDQLRVLLPWRLQRGSTIIPGRINPGRDLQPHSNVHCLHLHLHLQTNIITHIYSECIIYFSTMRSLYHVSHLLFWIFLLRHNSTCHAHMNQKEAPTSAQSC